MSKVQTAALILAAIGVYSYMSGKTAFTMAGGLMSTYLPLGAAAYLWLA